MNIILDRFIHVRNLPYSCNILLHSFICSVYSDEKLGDVDDTDNERSSVFVKRQESWITFSQRVQTKNNSKTMYKIYFVKDNKNTYILYI